MSASNSKKKEVKTESTLRLCNNFKISIKKSLVPLKIILFCYYGAGAYITAFLTVYFKQRGVSLAELSTAYLIAPAFQITGTLLSGVITDKIGRSKPVLVANLALSVLLLTSIILIPQPNSIECNKQILHIDCTLPNSNLRESNCSKEKVCDELCIKNESSNCVAQSNQSSIPDSLLNKNNTSETLKICTKECLKLCIGIKYNDSLCSVECPLESTTKCYDENETNIINKVVMLLYILWMTAFSNVYRILDVTAMFLVTEHNADYGKQRVFSMIGGVILSPLAGYLVKLSTPLGAENNYLAAFYFYMSLMILCIFTVYKLDVRVRPPGKKMGKKTILLLKSNDILVFALVLLVLGTSFMFTRKFLFWYLEEIKASSVLIGLIPSISALYGLPFLFTSEWWLKKIGTTRFFVISFLGYFVYGIGFSFLKDPWMSLLLESLSIVTYHILWVAVVRRSHEIAPEGLTASVISAAGSIHYHIGKASASLIARLVMNRFGGPIAFQFLAGMCFTAAVLYSIYLYCKKPNVSKSQLQMLEKYDLKENK